MPPQVFILKTLKYLHSNLHLFLLVVSRNFIKTNMIFCSTADPSNFAREDVKAPASSSSNSCVLAYATSTYCLAQPDSVGVPGSNLPLQPVEESGWPASQEVSTPLRCWMLWQGHQAIACMMLSPIMCRFFLVLPSSPGYGGRCLHLLSPGQGSRHALC